MILMADPMIALLGLQENLRANGPIDQECLLDGYAIISDLVNGDSRNSFAKIEDGEVKALAIFGAAEPIDGIICFSLGYAVNEHWRGRGLALEAANVGINKIAKECARNGLRYFYIEALVEVSNHHSLNVAKRMFSDSGEVTVDSCSGRPAVFFKRLIKLT